MLEIKDLSIEFGDFRLKASNILLGKGDKVILQARNNSGKSVFLLGLTGLIRTKTRNIFFDGQCSSKDLWQQFTGVYLDQSSIVPFLTPGEFFKLIGKLKNLSNGMVLKDVDKYSGYFKVSTRETKRISQLSLGTQKKVGIIASLLGCPRIVLWDEPFANLDDESALALSSVIEKELESTLVLLTSPTESIPFSEFSIRLSIKDLVVEIDRFES